MSMTLNKLSLIITISIIAASCTKAVKRDDSINKEEMTAPEYIGPINKIPATLSCNKGEEFQFSVSSVKWAESYEWTIAESAKDKLEVISGQGTTVITVKAADIEGVIPRRSVSVTALNSLGRSKVKEFLADITIGKASDPDPEDPEEVKLEGYRIKKYGTKYWMIENCHESGEKGNLGVAPDFSGLTFAVSEEVASKIKAAAGRYYTWYEAMTGIPECTEEQCVYKKGYSGKDSAGNNFSLDGSESEFNVQIRGCCPEGWHIANANDWWDLINAIKTEYEVPDDFVQCGYKFNGGHDPKVSHITKELFASKGCTVKNTGNVGAWLRGGNGRIADRGVWNQDKTQLSDAGELLNIFTSNSDIVDFGLYPTSRYDANGVFNTGALGKWGYIWGIRQGDTDRYASCYNISCTSLNFDLLSAQRKEADKKAKNVVRCVRNY